MSTIDITKIITSYRTFIIYNKLFNYLKKNIKLNYLKRVL